MRKVTIMSISSARTVACTLACVPLVLALMAGRGAAQDEHEHEKVGKGEIRVYLADKSGEPVDLEDVTATVVIEPKGGKKRILRTKLVRLEGTKKKGIGHGGEIRKMGDYHVEFVVLKPHEEQEHAKGEEGEEHAKGGEHEEHAEKEGAEHEGTDATPYFRAEIDLVAYACGMTGHTLLDKSGKCPECGMEAKPVDVEFAAVVIFRIGGETLNAKGFSHPPAVPDNYPDAVAKIEEHLSAIAGLIEAKELDKVHRVAELISHICGKLPELAPADGKAEIEKTCLSIIALFKEIDKAADAGKKDETVQVFEKYKAQVAVLKKHK